MGSLEANCEYEELRNARISENQARLASMGISKTVAELHHLALLGKPPRRTCSRRDYSSNTPRRSARLTGESKGSILKPDSSVCLEKVIRKEKRQAAAGKPAKPLGHMGSFSFFYLDFVKEYRENNPGKTCANLYKPCRKKWRSMTDEDKAPFVALARKRTEEYDQEMAAYERELAGEDEPAGKSKLVTLGENA